MAAAEKIRLTLDVSQELNRTLEDLAEKTGSTKSDLLRRAIALMEVAVDAKQNGQNLALSDKQDRVVTKIVGL
ncbi:MAG TPA: ribbon-helix-helix protein, CopG family [Polyangia bacterium]|nr:ribbon-helix-helix protein, CopG family [Polyangia bacterium]